MSLGENIYNLRKAKNLSQEELAEKLEVSRQSVSKWETDAAVPDLDKLIKLSDLFGVTLDCLVGRTTGVAFTPATAQQTPLKTTSAEDVVRIVAGCILLLASPLFIQLNFIIGLGHIGVLGISVFSGGIVCLTVKKHPWYWCLWIFSVFAEGFAQAVTNYNIFIESAIIRTLFAVEYTINTALVFLL